jgi:site-specific DNA recombinase
VVTNRHGRHVVCISLGMAQHPTTFLGYVRVSTEEQVVSGLSLDNQQQRLRAHVVAQGGRLEQLYSDAGLSGCLPSAKRPGLASLLTDVERLPRGSATLVVFRLDRLGRNAREVLNLEHELRRKGVQLASVTEQLDSSTPTGKVHLHILSAFAEYEASVIGERTYVAMRSALSPESVRVGGPAPFGYRSGKHGVYEPVADEAAVVRQVFRLFLGGDKSFAGVARSLNERGYRTRAGRSWSHSTVALLLRNARTYSGSRIWGRTCRRGDRRDADDWLVVPDAHEAIIDDDIARNVLAVLSRRDRRRGARRRLALNRSLEVAA